MEQLRAAVIGVGMIGSLHARIYADNPRTRLVAVVDSNAERARGVSAELGCAWYTDVAALLKHEHLDLVSVATPEQQRFAPAVACARAGIHLMLEKPLAPTLTEVDELITAVEACGVTATVNFILRSDPRYLQAKAAMTDGTVGEPCTIFARRRGTSVGAEIYGPWTELLISTAIHDLDAMVWLNGGAVERVYAEAVVKRCGQWGHEDAVMALLRFTNGVVGSLETSWVLPARAPARLDAALEVVGTAGGVFVSGSNHGMAILTADDYTLPDLTHWPQGISGVEGDLRANIDRFVRCVADNTPPAMTLREARYAQEIVAALKASIRLERPITLPLNADLY